MTATNFSACLAFTLRHEGGRADDPRDPGGRTNAGVTQRTYAAWLARSGRPSADVFAMSDADRDAIYRSGYWTPVGGDRLPAGLDLAMFDFAVNSGPARALRTGPLRAGETPAAAVQRVCAARLAFLRALPTFATFGRGWTARVADCEATGVKMAEQARLGGAPDATAVVRDRLAGHAAATAVSARRHGAAAGAVVAAGAAAVPAAGHLPGGLWLVAGIALVAAGVAAVFLVKAHQMRVRTRAYRAAASV